MSRRKTTGLVLLGAFAVLSGFFREFIFINLNQQRWETYERVYRHHSPEQHVAPSMQWLSGLSYETLNFLKWPLTLLFACWFAGLCLLAVRIAFAEKKYTRIVIFTYAGLFLLGLVVYGIGAATGGNYHFYEIARFLAGLTEGPLLMLILLASFLVMKRLRA